MGAAFKTQADCVPNHRPRKRTSAAKPRTTLRVYVVNNRTSEGYRKRPELYDVTPRWCPPKNNPEQPWWAVVP